MRTPRTPTTHGPGASIHGGSFRVHGNPIPYIAPWVSAILLLLLAGGVRLLLSHDTYSWYWSVLIAVAYTALTGIAHLASRARGKLTHLLATAGVGLAGTWSWYIAGIPNFTWRPLVVYIIGMVVICSGAMMLTAWKSGQPSEPITERLRKTVEGIRSLNSIQTADGRAIASLTMVPGATDEDIDTKALASAVGAPKDGIQKLPPKPGEPANLVRIAIDPTAGVNPSLAWTGPSIPQGGTLAQPILVGYRTARQPLQFWFPGDEKTGRNNSHLMVVGMPGSGKSAAIRLMLIDGMSRGPEFEYDYADPRKALQQPKWVLDGARQIAKTKQEVVALLRQLRDEEVPHRTQHLGERGLDQWVTGCGLTYRVIVLDEIAAVATDISRLLTDLGETLRSLGVRLVVCLQRASGTRFPTDARAQFGSRWCFGVESGDDADMALPEVAIEAGARPDLWADRNPGMCYLIGPGIPEDQWAQPGRTFEPNPEHMEKWARYYIQQRSKPQPALPEAPMEPKAHTQLEPTPEDPELLEDDTPDYEDIDDATLATEAEGIVAELLEDDEGAECDEDMELPEIPDEDTGDLRTIDYTQPIDTRTDGVFEIGLQPKMSDQAAREFLRRYLTELRDKGVTKFAAAELGDVLNITGMRGNWLRKWLRTWSQQPDEIFHKISPNGVYEFVNPTNPPIPIDQLEDTD